MSDAESHGPTEEWAAMEAARVLALDFDVFVADFSPHEPTGTEKEAARRMVVAAYPLIRERVCQELAEALREKAHNDGGERDFCYGIAAEFVERFGKADRGGEDG